MAGLFCIDPLDLQGDCQVAKRRAQEALAHDEIVGYGPTIDLDPHPKWRRAKSRPNTLAQHRERIAKAQSGRGPGST